MTEKSLIADFHFCATVSASGVNEKACLPSVLASRSARLATVLFSVKTSYRQFRLFRLLLLVLGCTFLGSPFILLLLIHFVHFLHFRSPCVNPRVDASLARCKITGDVGDEVQRVHLAVNGHLHARSEHSDGWTDGCNHGHCQCRTHCARWNPACLAAT